MRSYLVPLAVCMITALQAHSAEIPQQVKIILNRDRDIRAGMYDNFDSTFLGKTASPAETAATQRNWLEYYGKPAEKLPAALREELAKKYGSVKVFGAPRAEEAFPLGIVGAHAIDANARPELTVTAVEAGTPADGKLMEGDVIVGANGRAFPDWEDPRVPMGCVISAAQSEAHQGKMTLHVGRGGKIVDVVISLPVCKDYDMSTPFTCERSREIADRAVAAVIAKGDDTMFMDLFLMGCGDEKAIALVRDRMRGLEGPDRLGNNWFAAYKLVSLCEYHLLTGDRKVLPTIEKYVRALEANQVGAGGWGHGPKVGYGYMNQVGQVVLIGLTLAIECGIEPDPTVYSKGIGQITRFIGTYTAYGDHLPGIGRYRGSAGENGTISHLAVLFQLLGEPDVARRCARRTSYLYRTRGAGHGARIFSIGWGSMGPAMAPKAEFAMYASNMAWFYELARQRDGSLRNVAKTRFPRNTAGVGMAYTLAEKRLRIVGKKKGASPLFPVDELPEAPAHPPAKRRGSPKAKATEIKREWDVSSVAVKPTTLAVDLQETTLICEHAPEKYTHCMVTLPGPMAGELWLNGKCVAIFPAAPSSQKLHTLQIGKKLIRLLRKGENRWAVRSATSDQEATLEISLAPAQSDGKGAKLHLANYRMWRSTNGWNGTYRQHQEGVAWAFKDKTPREIARYLAYPDAAGAHAAYKALAAGGEEALALCKKLVTDKHAGIRVGAWDTLAEMHKTKPLDAATCKELVAIAIAQIAKEDPCVGMPLCKAVGPMASAEDLSKILVVAARLNDPHARTEATKMATEQLKGRPDLLIPILIPVVEAKLKGNDIRAVGSAMKLISEHARTEGARKSLRAIAGVLDEAAPVTRGMFTDMLMHGGLLTVEHNLTPQTEKTPQLVSGLSKCFITVPETDWAGWAYASVFVRRLLYRLTAESSETIRITAQNSRDEKEPNIGDQSRKRKAELLVWADVLKRTGGDEAKLRQEALRLIHSKNPDERTVALSLVWPSQHALTLQASRYFAPTGVPDTSRIQDADTALKVALAAARNPELNRSIDWYMIWLTVNKYGTNESADTVVPLIADYLANHAFRVRPQAFHFHGIDQSLKVAEKHITPELKSPELARGLSKVYATCANNKPKTEQKLITLLKKMGPESKNGITQGIGEIETWLKSAAKEEKVKVINRWCNVGKDVKPRLAELKKLAEK